MEEWLHRLSGFPRVQDWQARQAADAVRIYLRSFLGQPTPAPGDGAFDSETALHRMSDALAVRHHAASTRRAYLGLARRFLDYRVATGHAAGATPTSEDALLFMAYVAKRLHVGASTRNQAFSGVLFFFRHGLGAELEGMAGNVRAHRGRRLPVVLTQEEAQAVLARTGDTSGLILRLIYGSGLRVSEAITLRVKDLDFGASLILVHSAKGDRDRTTLLPRVLVPELQTHLALVRSLHQADLDNGNGAVELPDRLERKYQGAALDRGRQYVLPAARVHRGTAGRPAVDSTPRIDASAWP